MDLKEQIFQMVKLQRIERERREVQKLHGAIPAKLGELDAAEANSAAQVAERTRELDDARRRYREFERESEVLQGQISHSHTKLQAVKTNKEYRSGLREIDDLKRRRSSMEDEMIELLDRIDATEAALTHQQAQHRQQVTRDTAERAALQEESRRHARHLTRLQQDHGSVTRQIDAGMLQTFFRVQKLQNDGVAVVPVVNAVCQGCNLNIPPQMYNELQRVSFELRLCPFCSRIIYWGDPAGPGVARQAVQAGDTHETDG